MIDDKDTCKDCQKRLEQKTEECRLLQQMLLEMIETRAREKQKSHSIILSLEADLDERMLEIIDLEKSK